MIRILLSKATFARNRSRREMHFDPKLKDFTSTYDIKKQLQSNRKDFQQQKDVLFSEVLKQKSPKLGQRFYVNKQQLNKKMRKAYTSKVRLNNLQPSRQDDLRFLQQDKSHLFDQTQAVQFEEKFQKQLFRKKEITRLLEQERLKPQNYLQGKENKEYLQYQQAKNQLKNLKIQSMMKYKNSNEQLQLLIESGFVDDPSNLELIIKHHQQKDAKQLKLLQNSPNSPDKYKETSTSNSQDKQLVSTQAQNSIAQNKTNKFGLQISVGPEQLGNIQKIDEYFQKYKTISEQQQKNCQKQLMLLKKIKQYQQKLFLSRYDAINFQYKGRVQFSHFRQNELISYLKNHQLQPKNLFLMFQQNQGKYNKQNLPVITPSVMSRIYTKSCFYQFPETDQNNQINMLNDPIFVKLEKKLFKNIDKVNDSFLAQCVWAYAKNHEYEMGLLKIQMSRKVQLAIIQQLKHRALYMAQDNLGLICKSLLKMTVLTSQEVDWSQIIQIIGQRLPQIEDSYVRQNIFTFLSLLPSTCYHETLPIISSNLNSLGTYSWDFIQTAKCFLRVSAFLLRYNTFLDKQVEKSMSHIIYNKSEQILKMIPKFSINDIPHLVTVIEKLGVRHPLITKVINGSKKHIIDIIHAQKQKLSKKTLHSISLSFALTDYQNALYFIPQTQQNLKIVKPVTTSKIILNSLFPFRVFDYNSINYYFYHQLGRFTQSQFQFLEPNQIIDTLLGFSIVGYKNQLFYDGIFTQILKKLNEKQISPQKQSICYMNIIKCYFLQKRINSGIYQEIQNRLQRTFAQLQKKLSPENYISLFLCMFSLKGRNVSTKFKQIYEQVMQVYLSSLLQHLDKQYLITLLFTQSIYENSNLNRINAIQKYLKQYSLQLEQQFMLFICKNNLQALPLEQLSEQIQINFFNKIKKNLIRNQQHIGTRLSYTAVYERVKQKLQKQFPNSQIQEKPMRFIIQKQKQVYFIATYDHLMARFEEDEKTFMSLFGVWKSYEIYYTRKGYSFNLVCSFLE